MDALFQIRRLRRAGLAGALTLGFGMFGAGVHGLASVDGDLDTASKRARQAAPVKHDCPHDRDSGNISERERL